MEDKFLARKHLDKAFDHFFAGRSRRAIKEARAAIKCNPKWSRPHWLIGHLLMVSEPSNVEAAIKEFRELTRKDPYWPIGHNELGRALAKQNRIEEAMVVLREALRLDPENLCARIELARCLLKRNNYREAITVLRGKPSLSPHYTLADAYLLIAEAWVKHGHEDLARPEWEFILTMDETIPAYRIAQEEARRRLIETDKPWYHKSN
jgi:predicted Zn-dependent protease